MFLRSQLIVSLACGEVDHQEEEVWQSEAEKGKERSVREKREGEREERTKENVKGWDVPPFKDTLMI